MRPFAKQFPALLLLLVSLNAAADFAQDLAAKFPATAGAKIERSFPGFFSVVKNGDVVFVRDDLSIMINGDVIDLNAQQSLTSKIRESNKPTIDVSKLNERDAIKFGNGKNKLYVFSDPDCPFCKQLEQDLGRLQDTQIFIFPFPLTSLHPNARVISESIWCSRDRAGAWKAYLLEGKRPEFRTCDNPVSRNLAYGEENRIQGTPALIFQDGTLIPGALPLARIEAQINASARSSK